VHSLLLLLLLLLHPVTLQCISKQGCDLVVLGDRGTQFLVGGSRKSMLEFVLAEDQTSVLMMNCCADDDDLR